jgi:polysaccharide export outer membrane protein
MLAKLTPLLLMLSLSACSYVAPGMYMGTPGEESNVEVPVLDSGEPVTAKATITPITADLIINQAAAARHQAEAVKAHFPIPPQPYSAYRIGPSDILSIIVWEHPELTIPAGEFRTAEATGNLVAEDGTVFYPYAGVVKVAGLTVGQVRDILTKRLAPYIEKPQLDVRVIAYRSKKVYVVGQVKTPGIQPIDDVPMTVTQAINRAGGVITSGFATGTVVDESADMAHVTLARNNQVFPINLLALYEQGDLSQNVLLQDGDVLNVPDNHQNRVFVIGEVITPSSRFIDKGRLTLAQALGDVGGVDPVTANAGHIYVIRGGGQGKPEIFHLDAQSPDALLLADRFNLAAQDVVYVDPAHVTRWNRVISQILPTTQTLNTWSNTSTPTYPHGR